MMYDPLDAAYYEEMEMEDDAYYPEEEDEHYFQATRAYRWVRPGYGNAPSPECAATNL